MNRYFTDIKKNFGFGCMRLPMLDGEVDQTQMCAMVDTFIENGFNYFDTAHGYLGGKSETALRECLTSRYPRDKYILTDKLTNFFSKNRKIFARFLNSSLQPVVWTILISTSCTRRTPKTSLSSKAVKPMKLLWN